MRGLAVVALAGSLAAALVACGYTTRRLADEPGVRSIGVAQFDNKTYRRDLEMRLTKAVAEEVRARTPWRLERPDAADAVLTGTIRAADSQVLAQDSDPDRSPIARRWRLEVACTLVDRRSGRVLRTITALGRQEFAPGRYGETEDGSATDAVLRSLAESIVLGLDRPVGDADAVPNDPKRAIPPGSPGVRPSGYPSRNAR